MTDEQKEWDVPIESLNDGVALGLINDGLERCWENILDPNTPPKEKRVVTLKVTLTPDAGRELVMADIACDVKLANDVGSIARIMVGMAGGKVVASEIVTPSRQTDLEQYTKEIDNVTPIDKGDSQ